MRDLLRIMVLMSVLFSFWSCTNQSEIIEEEEIQEELLLKKQLISDINGNVDNFVCRGHFVDKITIIYQEGVSVNEIMRIHLFYMSAWTLAAPNLPAPVPNQEYVEEWLLYDDNAYPNPDCLTCKSCFECLAANPGLNDPREDLDGEPTVTYY